MDFQYDIICGPKYKKDVEGLMSLYDFRYSINEINEDLIIVGNKKYDSLEDFILGSIFYKTKKNLFYFPLGNPENKTVNLNISFLDIIRGNDVLKKLLENKSFKSYLTYVNNFATFFRFSTNKITRLYWNPSLNAGIPLSAKEKDPMYELTFLLHDFGHLLLTDLIFTGNVHDSHAKQIYVLWRLIGESFTVVINEMLCVDYLQQFSEYKSQQKLDFDKPYKLYRIMKSHKIEDLLFASCLFFCLNNKSGFDALVDVSTEKNKKIYDDFLVRYNPVSKRGREWTEMNFDNMVVMKEDYKKWYSNIEGISSDLEFVTIEKFYDHVKETQYSDMECLKFLFEFAFEKISQILNPIKESDEVNNEYRKLKAFRRLMIGNIFLLIKYDCDCTNEIINNLKLEKFDISKMSQIYGDEVRKLFLQKKISANEYHIYKDIFIMIPPNILSKNSY